LGVGTVLKQSISTSLRTRLILAFVIIQIMLVTVLGVLMLVRSAENELQIQQASTQNILSTAEPNVIRLLQEGNALELKAYIDNLATNPNIAGIYVSNTNGNISYFVSNNDEKPGFFLRRIMASSDEKLTTLIRSLDVNGKQIGLLEIKANYRTINQTLQTLFLSNLLLLAGLLVINIAIIYWLVSGFTLPLKQLVRVARSLGKPGIENDNLLPGSSYREIQELGHALTESSHLMQEQISNLEHTQARLASSENQLRTLVNNMHEALFELDNRGNICFLNPTWKTITGHNTSTSFGQPFSRFIHGDEQKKLFQQSNLPNLDLKSHQIQIITSSEQTVWIELDARATFNEKHELTGIVGRFQDIQMRVELTESLQRHQEELYKLSVTDSLTGLYNRRHFDEILNKKLPQALENKTPLCLALIDIDGFKFINDTYGHITGDNVLKTVSELLLGLVRPTDTIARLAGDEFALILYNADINAAQKITESLLQAINQTHVKLTIGSLKLQASIGVAVAPIHGQSVQDLIGAADVALYQAKKRNRGKVEVLSTDISQGIMEVFSRGFELRTALERNDIVPTFQPIMDLETGKPLAYEVLANMKRGDAYITASEFIKVAEELGLVRDIDLAVIGQALNTSPNEVELFMNISLPSFNDKNFAKELQKLIIPAREKGRPITIEITERASHPLNDSLLQDIESLRDLGCKLALDDFGHGYSTYTYLKTFRPEYLKIEGSFVQGITDNSSDHMIVSHIHELATAFGAITIAENIENVSLEEAAREIGVNCTQGYYYGRPAIAQNVFNKEDDTNNKAEIVSFPA